MEITKKPNMNLVYDLIIDLKNTLEKSFGKIYIEKKQMKSTLDNNLEEKIYETTKLFELQQNKKPIYRQINSQEDLTKIKDEIKKEYKETVKNFWELFDKVEDQLDDNIVDSLEIIGKTLDNRYKKMDSSFKKFKIDDSWNIEETQIEFSKILQKNLKDILESTISSIYNGSKFNNVYNKVAEILNEFYSHLGIYTQKFKIGENISDKTEFINIIEMQQTEIKDISFKDKISYVESPAYLFNSDTIILEAKVSVWRVS